MSEQTRCIWCGEDPLYQQYHDNEWGVPCRDDKKLFKVVELSNFVYIDLIKKPSGMGSNEKSVSGNSPLQHSEYCCD